MPAPTFDTDAAITFIWYRADRDAIAPAISVVERCKGHRLQRQITALATATKLPKWHRCRTPPTH